MQDSHTFQNSRESKNVLIIGNGGREYSLALALRNDKKVKDIFFSPENPAATLLLDCKSFFYSCFEELLQYIHEHAIYLVIVGPEAPLMQGISEFLQSHNILVFAPSLANAQLEGSKVYMKNFISKLNIPTARYKEVSLQTKEEGFEFINSLPLPIVLKANGLCGGKGVLIVDSKQEAKEKLEQMIQGKLFGDSGRQVVIEEFLDGYELSVFALSNGDDYIILPACQDHKRLLDNDKGPNTGGMGAYTNLPQNLYNQALEEKIKANILTPTFQALKNLGNPYKGVLFAGIMIVKNEPYLLEYNVRFGDPECEVLMPLFKTSLFEVLESFAKGEKPKQIEFHDLCCVCVVLTSSDYAQDYKSNEYPTKITIEETSLQKLSHLGHLVFANTISKDGALYANSGRVIIAVGKATNLKDARDNAYTLLQYVHFHGKHYRKDIAHQALHVTS